MLEQLLEWNRQQPHLARVYLAGALVSTTCGVIGCFMILRRMSFLGDALAHSMLAGVTSGYLLMKLAFGVEVSVAGMLVGSLLAGLFTAGMIHLVSKFSRIKEDTAIGAMYTGVFALGGLLASFFSRHIHIDLLHFMTGNVLAVEIIDLWMMAGVAIVVLAVVVLFYRWFLVISFDPVMAISIGIPVALADWALTACTSLVVVSGVSIVGVILVVGLLITPAATARLVTDRLPTMLVASALFGLSSFFLGYQFATVADVAPGSSIVAMATCQFFVVWTLAPEHGLIAKWLRNRTSVPETVVEDVVGVIRRAGNATRGQITERLGAGKVAIDRAVRVLAKRKWIARSRSGWELTDSGEIEAKKLLRAHRLWESYLSRIGTPIPEVHQQADALEHVHDEAAVDYLDDRLGHPTHDPHGAEIPEDFVHLASGSTVNAALLREGRTAVVEVENEVALRHGLKTGDIVKALAREAEGTVWVFTTSEGREIRLDHTDADRLLVKLAT